MIESVSPIGGPSATIKSHHNVGGLPEELGFELIEPLRDLFKDEVRELGRELWACPGSLRHRSTEGSNALLRDGVPMIASAADLLQRFGLTTGTLERPDSDDPLVGALAGGAERPRELADRIDAGEGEVRRRLLVLELGGVVRRLPGDRYGLS